MIAFHIIFGSQGTLEMKSIVVIEMKSIVVKTYLLGWGLIKHDINVRTIHMHRDLHV